MRIVIVLLALTLVSAVYGKDEVLEWHRRWLDLEHRYRTDSEFQRQVDDHVRDWPPDAIDMVPFPDFECDVEVSEQVPTSVHELRPSDINVVAAFGDSITAGYGVGALGLPGVALENRGESWSIGGDYDLDTGVATLPNILKKFNSDLKGVSSCFSGRSNPRSWFNVAQGGAVSTHMPNQAIELVDRMRRDIHTDVDNDWKIVTIFIGGNDLCRVCRDPEGPSSPEAYANNIMEAIDTMHEDLPRTLVNMVPMFDVSPLTNMSSGATCDVLHQLFCGCAMDDDTRPMLRGVQMEYYDRVKDLIDSGRWDTNDDFTVVLQPHLRDIGPWLDENGDWDNSMFSYDCFHLNRKGHQGMAYALWNVMLTPVGEKPVVYDVFAEYEWLCPTSEAPYIFTNLNSEDPGTGGAKTPSYLMAFLVCPIFLLLSNMQL